MYRRIFSAAAIACLLISDVDGADNKKPQPPKTGTANGNNNNKPNTTGGNPSTGTTAGKGTNTGKGTTTPSTGNTAGTGNTTANNGTTANNTAKTTPTTTPNAQQTATTAKTPATTNTTPTTTTATPTTTTPATTTASNANTGINNGIPYYGYPYGGYPYGGMGYPYGGGYGGYPYGGGYGGYGGGYGRGNPMAMMMNAMNSMNAMNRLMNHNGLGGGFTDYTVNVDDDANVRRYRLPTVDEDNKPKKYTAEELKQLKGDGNLIGYTAVYDDLQVGQTITCRLSIQRTDPKDPSKVTWTTVQNLTGRIQRLEATSQKQFVLRVNNTGTQSAYNTQQRGNNNNNPMPAAPNKFATLVVIYSDVGPAVAAAKN